MKKRDVILLCAILAVCAASFFAVMLFQSGEGSSVRISVAGEAYGEYSLSEDQTIEIDNEYGRNVVIISGGKVYMSEADCPDGYCIGQGEKGKSGQTIVCLPHKLVVEIIGDGSGETEPDGIAR